ncbi:MAG: Gfo/Idh/MocA family oxidoreductase [Rhodobacteraceae bacterium]|nr:Gfo/Idh/MocA family oxidoreductase [Paracoccaceae bacterium]
MTDQSSIKAPIQVGLIGCGGWGKNIARNLKELGALAAIADPSELARNLAEQHQARYVTDAAALFADDSITAVAVAAPAKLHHQLTKQAFAAGKDVFVEKPIALDVNEAFELKELAAQHDRVLMVGHLLQYHPVFLHLKDLVRDGKFGRIRHIYSSRLNLGVLRTEENVLWSFAPHDISMILALMGRAPNRVAATENTVLQTGIPDTCSVNMDYGTGPKAEITVSWLHPLKEQQLVVVGDDAMAVFRDTKPWSEKLVLHHNKVTWDGTRPSAVRGETETVDVPQGEPLKEELRHFLQCAKNRTTPRTGPEEAIPVLAVLQAAQTSLDKGGDWIELPPLDGLINGVDEPQLGKAAPHFVHHTSETDDGVKIGRNCKIWHYSHILSGSRLGDNCVVGQNVMIGPNVNVGSGCKIQNNVSIYAGVELEDDVFCGPSMVFTNVLTPRAHVERKDEFAPTLVKTGASIGANATIVCGITIGRFAMIGAGAVVTKDVPDHALVVGNPARQIGWVSETGERLGEDMTCPRTGKQYHELKAGQFESAA